jgi:sigma54-dependent transcription regulator
LSQLAFRRVSFAAVRASENLEEVGDRTVTETDARDRAATSQVVTTPHLFVALDCDRPRSGVSRHSLANVERVVIGRDSERSCTRSHIDGARTLLIHIPDPRASRRHAIFRWQDHELLVQDSASRNSTRVNGLKVDGWCVVADGDIIQIGHTLFRYRRAFVTPFDEPMDLDTSRVGADGVFATTDPFLARRTEGVRRIAHSQAPVLVLGDTGTGKEVVARSVHRLSDRSGDLVAVNCGALPPTLLESQLFGHVRGSFSGASRDAPGLIRSADGGTLFLDEIGDLPLHAQAALLRVLEEHEVLPIGASRATKVNLRVVAATRLPLEELVAQGRFRSDLFARLSGLIISLPPLRERADDIGVLIAAFADKAGTPMTLTCAAGRALLGHDWPHNVRELFQVLRVAAALAEANPIDLEHLPPRIGLRGATGGDGRGISAVTVIPLRDRLVDSLERNQGNVSRVARELGKPRTQLHRWLRRFSIDASVFRKR